MALVTSSSATAKGANAYRSIMLGSTPASLAKKPTSAGSAMATAQAPKPAAKPATSAPAKSPYDSSGRMTTTAPAPTAKPANQPPPAATQAPAPKPVVPAPGLPANQPPPAVPTPPKIDNSQGGAGAGVLPGKPIVPPTDKGVPPNMGPGASGGGTQGGIPSTPPPKATGVPKVLPSLAAPAQAYPTFNAGGSGYDPKAYSAPKGMAYSLQAANQAPYTFSPQRLSASPPTSYPTVTPGQTSAPQLSTTFARSAYPTAGGFDYEQRAIEAASAGRRMAVPASMSYQTQRSANMPYTPGIGTANRVPTAPTQSYGQVTMPQNYGQQLAQPSFMGYPGQGPATPPPMNGYNPGAGREMERTQGTSGYNPGAGRDMAAAQGQTTDPWANDPFNRGAQSPPADPWQNDPFNRGAQPPPVQSPYDASGRMGGSTYAAGAGNAMATAQGSRGPSYQEIMMRQQTGAYMPRLSPQELMAQRQRGSYGMGGY